MLRQLRTGLAARICSLSWASGATEAAAAAGLGAASSSNAVGRLPVEPATAAAAAVAAAPWAAAPAWQAQQVAHYSKANKGKKGGAAAEAAAADAGATFDMSETRSLMERALGHLQGELANIRTGRATPGMLDHLKVDVYGDRLPLKACGSVSVRDPQLLVVTVFDKDVVPAVVKAVAESPLRLQPRSEGQEVLVPVPRPTIETIGAMMKVCKGEGEAAKVSVRHARKLAMDATKKLGSEDERKRVEREVQKLTDDFIGRVEGLVAAKEKSIRSHDS